MNKFFVVIFSLVISSISYAETKASLSFSDVRQLAFYYDGVVSSVAVTSGDTIKKGNLLARLDSTLAKLIVKQKQAELDAQSPIYNEAVVDNERSLELYDRGVLSEVGMNENNKNLAISKANNVLLKTKLKISQKQLSYYQLASPYDAVVIANNLYVGKKINNQFRLSSYITLAAKDKVQFSLKGKRNLFDKKNIRVSIGNKRYSAIFIALDKQAKIYQVSFKNAHLSVGKNVTIR